MARRRIRRSKYGVRTDAIGKWERTVDGIQFPSKAEATRYRILKNREQAGKISNLELQPRFEIIPAFTDSNGQKHSATRYTADFKYQQGEDTVIEEVKGKASRDFALRMKLFLRQYPEYTYKLVKTNEVLTAP